MIAARTGSGTSDEETPALSSVRMRWFAVFDQALRASDVIAVWRAVEQHLDRPLTRAELAAARRAAHRYAATAQVRFIRVPAPAGSGGIRTIPLLARLDADLDDIERLSALAAGALATGPSHRRPGGTAGERSAMAVASVVTAARRSRRLPVARLDPVRAAALADDLAAGLAILHDLERRLRAAADRGGDG
ncbi:MAG TPA: hypothetical protein VFU98_12820 [Microlunatus sp.]|nr:hypothetical protein [Microlunatus sp.]